jgi:hypothetical protein
MVKLPAKGAVRVRSSSSQAKGRETASGPPPTIEAQIPWRCEECGERDDDWSSKCPHCGARNAVMYRPEPDGSPAAAARATAAAEPDPDVHAGIAVEPGTATERVFERVLTGFPALDAALSGGLAKGTVGLIGAPKKTGKTTLLLGILQNVRGPVAYATAEQSQDQVIGMAQRVGATRRGLYVFDAREIDDALARFDRLRARLVVLDSLNRFRVRGAGAERGTPKVCAAVLDRCQAWARDRSAVVILVSHFTKDGDFVGSSGVQHDVDLGLVMHRDAAGRRVVRVEMSRIGPDDDKPEAWFRPDARGAFVPCDPPPPPPPPAPPLAVAVAPVQDAGHGTDGSDRRRRRPVDDPGEHAGRGADRAAQPARRGGREPPRAARRRG